MPQECSCRLLSLLRRDVCIRNGRNDSPRNSTAWDFSGSDGTVDRLLLHGADFNWRKKCPTTFACCLSSTGRPRWYSSYSIYLRWRRYNIIAVNSSRNSSTQPTVSAFEHSPTPTTAQSFSTSRPLTVPNISKKLRAMKNSKTFRLTSLSAFSHQTSWMSLVKKRCTGLPWNGFLTILRTERVNWQRFWNMFAFHLWLQFSSSELAVTRSLLKQMKSRAISWTKLRIICFFRRSEGECKAQERDQEGLWIHMSFCSLLEAGVAAMLFRWIWNRKIEVIIDSDCGKIRSCPRRVEHGCVNEQTSLWRWSCCPW